MTPFKLRGHDVLNSQVMGILNITPDSFSDGGDFFSLPNALAQARRLLEAGADWLDIGGESTRPGAQPVPVQQELDRVIPVLEQLRREFAAPLSVDTAKPEVMREAIRAGAKMINDVNALRAEGALETVANSQVAVCLMHMQGQPRTMQQNPHYGNVTQEIKAFLQQRISVCEAAGINKQRLYIDPGFGFGKTLQHNLTLMRELGSFQDLECSLLIGVSRKSMLAAILDKPPKQRIYGGLALAVLAGLQGAALIRTHDVEATVDVLKTIKAVYKQ